MWFIAAGSLTTCVSFLFKEKNTTSFEFSEINFRFILSLKMPIILSGWFFSNAFYLNCLSKKSF